MKPQTTSYNLQINHKPQQTTSKRLRFGRWDFFGRWKLVVGGSGKGGFTLVETLVALFILSASLVALLTVASRGLVTAKTASNQVIAHYLAQEGLEAIYSIRNTNFINDLSWLSGIETACSPDGSNEGCYLVNGVGGRQTASCGSSCDPIFLTETAGTYTTGVGDQATPFRRVITTEVLDPTSVRVASEVTWQQGRVTRRVRLVEVLMHWEQ